MVVEARLDRQSLEESCVALRDPRTGGEEETDPLPREREGLKVFAEDSFDLQCLPHHQSDVLRGGEYLEEPAGYRVDPSEEDGFLGELVVGHDDGLQELD